MSAEEKEAKEAKEEKYLKVVTWNINGIKARGPYVELFLDEHKPDILCIQELKSRTEQVPTEIFTDRGYEVAVFGQRSWNGVMIASKYPMTDVEMGLPDNGHEDQSRAIAATIEGMRIINLYCPQGQQADSDAFQFKKRFYDRLQDWIESVHTPEDELVITGDFNIAPKKMDVYDLSVFNGVPTHHPEELSRWYQLLEWGLFDVSEGILTPGTFTFWDYRRLAFPKNNGLRIDHFLGTKAIEKRTKDVKVIRDFRKKKNGLTASDHAPVELSLELKD